MTGRFSARRIASRLADGIQGKAGNDRADWTVMAETPLGFLNLRGNVPRVVAARQPWAGGCNAVGVENVRRYQEGGRYD